MSRSEHRRRAPVLAALMLTMALAAMDTTIVSTAIPQIVGDLGGFSLFSWVFSIYLLAQTVTIPVYGKLADLFGRKPILIVGSLIFLVGSAASAFAPSMVWLIVFRGLQGLGAGSIQATVATVAGDLYTLEERGRVQGWLASVWGVAAIVGPTLGGSFAEYASWRWIFLVNLPIGAVALTLIWRFLHEDVQRRRDRIDYLGAALILAAGGMTIFALLQGGTAWAWWSAPSVISIAIAGGLIAVTLAVERRAATPILPLWVWRKRLFAGSSIAMLGLGLLVIGPSTFLPTYAQAVLGLGPIAAGLLLATSSITWPISAALSNRLYLRIGFRDTALIGALFCVSGAAIFLLLPYPPAVWALVAVTLIMGAGYGLISTPTVVGVQSAVGWSERGVVTGANMFARFLGQSLGAAIFGAISNATLRHQLAQTPASVRDRLPQNVNEVSDSLKHPATLGTAGMEYLRHALSAATSHIYLSLAIIGALTCLCLLIISPRRFRLASEKDSEIAAASEGADRGETVTSETKEARQRLP